MIRTKQEIQFTQRKNEILYEVSHTIYNKYPDMSLEEINSILMELLASNINFLLKKELKRKSKEKIKVFNWSKVCIHQIKNEILIQEKINNNILTFTQREFEELKHHKDLIMFFTQSLKLNQITVDNFFIFAKNGLNLEIERILII